MGGFFRPNHPGIHVRIKRRGAFSVFSRDRVRRSFWLFSVVHSMAAAALAQAMLWAPQSDCRLLQAAVEASVPKATASLFGLSPLPIPRGFAVIPLAALSQPWRWLLSRGLVPAGHGVDFAPNRHSLHFCDRLMQSLDLTRAEGVQAQRVQPFASHAQSGLSCESSILRRPIKSKLQMGFECPFRDARGRT